MENIFELHILDIHWVNDIIDNEDLCVHGKMFVKIDNEIISDDNSGDWTLTATGLYLLRSLNKNYEPYMYNNFLLPCCAFDFWLDDNNQVFFMGCINGIDFIIEHHENNIVKIRSLNGAEAIINKSKFSDIVYKFTSEIEIFYKNKEKKVNKENKKGYKVFWDEWKKIKKEYYDE
jgi:hypothetical protein